MTEKYSDSGSEVEVEGEVSPDGFVEIEYSDQPFGPSTVIAALDQIENLVDLARAVPLSANVVVNKAEILDLVRQAKEALPDDLVAANAVVSDADAVLIRADSAAEAAVAEAGAKASTVLEDAREQANTMLTEADDEATRTIVRAQEEAERTQARASNEAERMLKEARDKAEKMVAADRVTHLARQRAQETVNTAQAEAAKLASGADQYVTATLTQVSGILSDLQRRTDAGLKKMAGNDPIEAANIDLE